MRGDTIMRRLSWGAIIVITSCSMAFADGSVKDGPAPASPWSGFYVGGQAGAAWANWDVGNAISTPGVGPFADPGFPLGEFDGSGAVAGVHAGFNRQIGSIVVGLEADISWSGADSSRDFIAAGIGPGLPLTVENTLEYYGTLRARVGLARERLLVYATGGFAWASSKTSITSPGQLAGPFATSDRNTHSGWTAGLGADFMMDSRWILGFEYKHMDLGSENYAFTFPLADVNASTDLVLDEVTLRAKHRF
jgi:outer membrane immunogenic protein